MSFTGKHAGRFHKSGPWVAGGAVKERNSIAEKTSGTASSTGLEVSHHSSGALRAGKVVVVADLS
jgi:hypothetical protein